VPGTDVTAADRAAGAAVPVEHDRAVEPARTVHADAAPGAAGTQAQDAAHADARDVAVVAQHEPVAALQRIRASTQAPAAQLLEAREQVLQDRDAGIER
jgi:lipopolysaccharide biosynthesis protein